MVAIFVRAKLPPGSVFHGTWSSNHLPLCWTQAILWVEKLYPDLDDRYKPVSQPTPDLEAAVFRNRYAEASELRLARTKTEKSVYSKSLTYLKDCSGSVYDFFYPDCNSHKFFDEEKL